MLLYGSVLFVLLHIPTPISFCSTTLDKRFHDCYNACIQTRDGTETSLLVLSPKISPGSEGQCPCSQRLLAYRISINQALRQVEPYIIHRDRQYHTGLHPANILLKTSRYLIHQIKILFGIRRRRAVVHQAFVRLSRKYILQGPAEQKRRGKRIRIRKQERFASTSKTLRRKGT